MAKTDTKQSKVVHKASNNMSSSCACMYKKTGYWKQQGKSLVKYKKLIWFLIPAALFTLVFSYIPMLGTLFSFKGSFDLTKGDILYNLVYAPWTFQNYLDIFSSQEFFKAVGNTLIINGIKLVIVFPLSIIIAVQLSELKSSFWSKFILIILCLPNFFSWAVVIGIWSGLLDSQSGVLNGILVNMNILQPNYDIMSKDAWFKPLVIFFAAWKGAGWGSIMFYAAIMGIDKTYYESATIDGANKLQKIIYLTLPSIMPTIALMLVMTISGMLSAGFEQVYTMMQLGSNFEETQIILDTFLYNISVVNRDNIPFATALGVFNGFIALAFMLIGNFITRKTLNRSLW